jgi:hypothetical protein
MGERVEVLGEVGSRVLLLAPDQQTGVGGTDRDQGPFTISCRGETVVGASGDLVSFVADYCARIVESSCDRTDDPANAVANIVLFEQFVFCPRPGNTVAREKLSGCGQTSLVTNPDQVTKTSTSTVLLGWGTRLTIRELMEEQRKRVRSS